MFNVLMIIVTMVIEFLMYILYRYFEERITRPDRYKNWKAWAKRNTNNPIYKLFVLFGWCNSPSLECYFALEEYRERWSKQGFTVAETYKDVRRKEKTDGDN